MSIQRTRKDKQSPHYNFLYSWTPSESYVNREITSEAKNKNIKLSASKKADIQAKEDMSIRIKKDLIKTLILVSFIVILEVVVYLAWNKYVLS